MVPDGSGGFNVIGTNNFVDAGTLNPTITITDPNGASVTVTATATVAGLTATGETVNAVQGSSYSGVLATFADDASDHSGQTYTASIDWGDGDTSTGTVTSVTGGYTVSGTHTYDLAGSQSPTITILASDGRTVAANASATIAGLTVNEDDVTAVKGTSFSGTVADFTDNAPDALAQTYTASIDWGDGSSPSTGTVTAATDGSGDWTVTGTHTYSTAGDFTPVVTVTAADARTGSVTDAADVTTVTGIEVSDDATQGTRYSGEIVTFSDATSGTTAPEYSASINWGDGNVSSGVITSITGSAYSITGTNEFQSAGTFNPVVTITDPSGATATITSAVDVAGVSFSGETITENQGTGFTGTEVADFTDNASDHSSQTYTAVIDWGDGSSSTGSVASDGSGGYTVSGDHTYDAAGSFTPTIIVSASDGRITTGSATANVNGLTTDSETINAVQGTSFSGKQVADFTDTASDASSQTYTASINWGDGSSSSTGTVASDGNGGFTVKGGHTYSTAGNYSPVITITASDSRTAEADASADVSSLTTFGVSFDATQGTSYTGSVAAFDDANSGTTAADYTATIDWGDGNESSGIITGNDTVGFTIVSSNNYASAGYFGPTVTITEPSGATVAVTDDATVSGIVITGQTVTPTQGKSFTGVIGTFTDSAADHSSQTYTAIINWGDGNTSAGTVASAGSDYTVTGTNTFATDGTFNPTVTVVASDGRVSSAQGEADVTIPPDISISGDPSVNEGAEYTLDLSAQEFGGNTITGWSINWGDGTTDTPTGDPSSATHTFGSGVASSTITATATDAAGTYDADASLTVTVLPAAPTDVAVSWNEDGTAAITWTNASSLLNSNSIEVSSDGGSTWTTLGTTTGSATSYTASGLSADDAEQFAVVPDTGTSGSGTPGNSGGTSIPSFNSSASVLDGSWTWRERELLGSVADQYRREWWKTRSRADGVKIVDPKFSGLDSDLGLQPSTVK